MKKVCLLITLFLCLVSCSHNTQREAFEDYMTRFPESSLQDVYKWCFQDVFGPAHLVSDTAASAAYIRSELTRYRPDSATPMYEYTGPDGRYVRVNLSLVADSVITVEQLVDALVRSSSQKPTMSVEQWRERWVDYVDILADVEPRPLNFESDAQKIDSLLSKGQYVMHHSRHFNETYLYFYRIIARDIFEQEILPVINSKKL